MTLNKEYQLTGDFMGAMGVLERVIDGSICVYIQHQCWGNSFSTRSELLEVR